MGCFASLAMTASPFPTCIHILAALIARGLYQLRSLLEYRGRREDRVRAAPAVSCAKCTEESAHEHTGSAETLRPSLRNGFTAYSALSPVTGFLATIASRDNPQSLTPASGRRNHTISPYAQAALVSRSLRVHRISPHVRDDREPPLIRVRRPINSADLPDALSGIFLRIGLDSLRTD